MEGVSPEFLGIGTACLRESDPLAVTSSRLQRTNVLVSYFDPSDHPPTSLHCKAVMVPNSTPYRVVPRVIDYVFWYDLRLRIVSLFGDSP